MVVQDSPFYGVGERACWELRLDFTAVLNCGEPESYPLPAGGDANHEVFILSVASGWGSGVDHLVTTKIPVTDAQ
jgi:hypothetical protein